MKKKLRNRFVSLFLAVVFVLCASVPAGAVSPVQGWITDSDLFIGEEAAKYIAEFFVRDMIETGTTCWNSERGELHRGADPGLSCNLRLCGRAQYHFGMGGRSGTDL